MSRPGRLIRQSMRPDAFGAAEERRSHRAACERAHAEFLERYRPEIDRLCAAGDVAGAAAIAAAGMEWQQQRITELCATRAA